MFTHLLVPLDGSKLAEAVLGPVRTLATANNARVTLLHVLEQGAPTQVHGDRHLADVAEANAYLETIAKSLAADGLTVDHHVHDLAEASVTRSIADHGRELGADLVVLATHGGNSEGMLVGTNAQQVIANGAIPVLVIQPETVPADWSIHQIVVPLDGAPEHDAALPAARALAHRFGAKVDLVTAVPYRSDLAGPGGAVGRFLPSAMSIVLDHRADEQADRLTGLVEQLRAEGIPAAGQLHRGEPAAEILEALQATRADLVVMATHTKHGLAAFWARSVAPRVIQQWQRPTLLVRAGE